MDQQTIGIKSQFANYLQTLSKECHCKKNLEVQEFVEPIVNDSGKILVSCTNCFAQHEFNLLVNIDGCVLNENLKLIDYEYD